MNLTSYLKNMVLSFCTDVVGPRCRTRTRRLNHFPQRLKKALIKLAQSVDCSQRASEGGYGYLKEWLWWLGVITS
uniref:Uncharacterized protein n=1 Tax=Parascaris equorum TaxID=6256 RepID=A0A914S2T1_PAREQ